MSVSLVMIAVGLTRLWTRLYTCRLPDDLRNARRAEIESDLWDWRHDVRAGGHDQPTAMRLLARLICGVPDDLSWRIEQVLIPRGAVWGMTAASLGVPEESSDPGNLIGTLAFLRRVRIDSNSLTFRMSLTAPRS